MNKNTWMNNDADRGEVFFLSFTKNKKRGSRNLTFLAAVIFCQIKGTCTADRDHWPVVTGTAAAAEEIGKWKSFGPKVATFFSLAPLFLSFPSSFSSSGLCCFSSSRCTMYVV